MIHENDEIRIDIKLDTSSLSALTRSMNDATERIISHLSPDRLTAAGRTLVRTYIICATSYAADRASSGAKHAQHLGAILAASGITLDLNLTLKKH